MNHHSGDALLFFHLESFTELCNSVQPHVLLLLTHLY